MLKVLVVDDEAIHREGIIQIIRSNRPDYVVLEARNGLDALHIAETEALDLIITDVRMPRMDGLKFVESIRKLNHKTRIVILSGYRNFEYAQKALTLGASEYLVKPTRESDFLAVLCKIEDAIETEVEKEKTSSQFIKKLDDSLPIYFDKLMNLWILGLASQAELQEISDLFSLHQKGVVLAIQFLSQASPKDTSLAIKGLGLQQQMKYRMKKILEPSGSSISFFSSSDDQLMVTVLLCHDLNSASGCPIVEQLEKFIDEVRIESGLTAIVGIGGLCENVLNCAATSFQQARQALAINFYDPGCQLITYGQAGSQLGNSCPDLARFEEPLLTAIRQNATEQVSTLIDQMFSSSILNVLPPPEQLIKNNTRLALNTASVVSNFMEGQSYEELLVQIESRLIASRSLPLLKAEFRKIMLELLDWLANLKKNKHDLIMKMCLQYLENNLKEDLTLKMVADHFYFSPSYFSELFKDYSNLTFNKYVSRLRLKKAAELLSRGCFRVYEVAIRVGYNDEKYFHRVFKKEFGVTPDEYRRMQK